jgi:hypothetical protein
MNAMLELMDEAFWKLLKLKVLFGSTKRCWIKTLFKYNELNRFFETNLLLLFFLSLKYNVPGFLFSGSRHAYARSLIFLQVQYGLCFRLDLVNI